MSIWPVLALTWVFFIPAVAVAWGWVAGDIPTRSLAAEEELAPVIDLSAARTTRDRPRGFDGRAMRSSS